MKRRKPRWWKLIVLLTVAGLVVWVAWSDYSQHGELQPGRAIDAKYLVVQAFVGKNLDALMAYYSATNKERNAPTKTEPPAHPPRTPPVVKSAATPTLTILTATPAPTPTLTILTATPAPTPTSPAPTAPAPPTKGLSTAEGLLEISRLTHDLINEERHNSGLSPLEYDDKLAAIARKHSEDMAQKEYFAHDNQRGESFSARYRQDGYNCANKQGLVIHKGAENIFQGWEFGRTTYRNGRIIYREWFTAQQIAEQAVSGWISSPGHRANILTPFFDREGIGVAADSVGKLLITQNFC